MPGGRPKTTVPNIDRFMARVEKQEDGCWYWMGSRGVNDYGFLSRNAGWETRYAHRWSYIHHKGPITDGKMIRHTCDVRFCVNPEHLIEGDSVDNVRDMIERNPDGCHRAFRPEIVKEIRKARASPPYASIPELAKRYGVSNTAMGNLLNRKTYDYVSD
jgi:HNH endonuclease